MPQHVSWVDLWDAFGAGVYVLFCITQFNFYRRRRDRTAHLFIALASAGALLVDVTGIFARWIGPKLPFLLAWANLFGTGVATVALYEFAMVLGGPHQRQALSCR